MNNSSISEKKKNTGRKNSFTEEQLAHILALQNRGEKITDIARQYHVSRKTSYSQIKRAYNFSDDPDVKMRMNFMNHDDLCTTIDIDFRHEKIKIKNYTDQIIFRAFGVVTEPDWADFEYFLEERCFPRTRDHRKDILREMGLPFYDPLLIIEKTQGRMSDDHQWKFAILMHSLPCIRAVILPREISSNGKLMTGGIRLTIWDMKVYRKFLYLTFCRKVPVLFLLLSMK